MARPKRSRGFTLVELLVVITIIGMLVSLLLPAIQAAREAGRRTTCLNNMRQVGVALAGVEQSKKSFPGYVSPVQKTGVMVPPRASWIVSILPGLEQSQLYQNWMNPALGITWGNAINRGQYITQLSILLCPSNANPDLLDDALSFVINTGVVQRASDNFAAMNGALTTPTWPEDAASGVSFNLSQADYAVASRPGFKKVNMDYISTHDGSTNTLLVTENLQAGGWATDPANVNAPFQTDFAARQSTGFVWFITGNVNNTTPPTSTMTGSMNANYNPDAINVNDYAQVISGRPTGNYSSGNTSAPTGLAYARPSANHPGGVNAMFCGGNGRFIAEEIDYRVFTQLMTGYQNHVVVDYANGDAVRANHNQNNLGNAQAVSGGVNSVPVPWDYILNEAEL